MLSFTPSVMPALALKFPAGSRPRGIVRSRMSRIATLFALACALMLSASPSQAQTYRKITKAQLDQLMKAEGYSTRRDSDDDIVWTQDGLRWVVFVMSEGTSIQVKFAVGDTKATLERINEWNRGKRYSRSYLDLDGDPNLALDLDLSGGVERARIVDFLRTASISRSAWIKEVFRP